jgi:hypothetical protein
MVNIMLGFFFYPPPPQWTLIPCRTLEGGIGLGGSEWLLPGAEVVGEGGMNGELDSAVLLA